MFLHVFYPWLHLKVSTNSIQISKFHALASMKESLDNFLVRDMIY